MANDQLISEAIFRLGFVHKISSRPPLGCRAVAAVRRARAWAAAASLLPPALAQSGAADGPPRAARPAGHPSMPRKASWHDCAVHMPKHIQHNTFRINTNSTALPLRYKYRYRYVTSWCLHTRVQKYDTSPLFSEKLAAAHRPVGCAD